MYVTSALVVACGLALNVAAWAAPARGSGSTMDSSPADAQLLFNSLKTEMHLTLDRTEYLAGEIPRITVGTVNPTQSQLAVLDPFGKAGCLELRAWLDGADPGSEWRATTPDGGCYGLAPGAAVLTLQPGEKHEVTLPSAKSSLVVPSPPTSGGRFQLSFCYRNNSAACAYAEFTVVEPLFRAFGVAQLKEPSRITNGLTGAETRYPRYLKAYFLEYKGKGYIAVQRRSAQQSTVLLSVGQQLSGGDASELDAYDRVAEVGTSITELKLAADSEENLTVSWMENGAQKSYCVSADRSQIRQCTNPVPVEISIAPQSVDLGQAETLRFVSTVTGGFDPSVRWTLRFAPDTAAESEGKVDDNGNYSAPSSIPFEYDVIVTATSWADQTKAASARITLHPLSLAAAPTFSPAPGAFTGAQTVSIATTTPNASIRYTTDGSQPSATNGRLYAGAFTFTQTTTFRAVAFTSVTAVSPVTTATYTRFISVSPASRMLAAGESETFSVLLGNGEHQTMTWTISPNVGSLRLNGPYATYSAPASITSAQNVTLTATTQDGTVQSCSATITLTPVLVSVSPKTASTNPGGIVRFTATVLGSDNKAVTWYAVGPAGIGGPSIGSITPDGVYTAGPADSMPSDTSIIVTAVSKADGYSRASASVTVAKEDM